MSARMLLPMRRIGDCVFLSGHGCEGEDGKPIVVGHVGDSVTLEEGQRAARRCAQRMLEALECEFGTLDAIECVVKVLGFVNSAEGFDQQPLVMNGFSEVLVERLGERGLHARTAIGVNMLPNNQAVEVEMIVKLRSEK